VVIWPLYRKVMVKGQPHTVHVKGEEEVPTHLDDLVVELTEADENWLILNSIAWSGAA
jgi:hypothetical protein